MYIVLTRCVYDQRRNHATKAGTLCASSTMRTSGTSAAGNICSSEKMHRLVHCATHAANIGDLINTEAMSGTIHRISVQGPQHLLSRSDKTGPGLLKVA